MGNRIHAACGAAALFLIASAAAPASAADTPAATPFTIGAFKAFALWDATDALPNDGKVFGIDQGTAAVAAALRAAGAPADKVALGINVLLVKGGGRVMLFDTGIPPQVSALRSSLAMAGEQPSDITDIFITHSHGDHVGGLTDHGQLTFANAAIHMSAAEWAAMKASGKQADVVKIITPKVRTFQAGQAVVPGVLSVDLAGHTPGHVGYQIHSGAARLLDIGDLAHSAILSLANPRWKIGFDEDQAKGAAVRRRTLAELAKSHETVFAPHFPYPGVGRIQASGGGFRWKPQG